MFKLFTIGNIALCAGMIKPQDKIKVMSSDDDFHKRQKQYGMSNDDTVKNEKKTSNELNKVVDSIKTSHDSKSPEAIKKRSENRNKVVGPLKKLNTKTDTQNEIINMAKDLPNLSKPNKPSSDKPNKPLVTSETTGEKTESKKSIEDTKEKIVAKVSEVAKADGKKGDEDWDMIKEYRAEKCAEREDPANHADCMKFMNEICKPGGADGKEGEKVQMNNEEGENGSGKGFCDAFFDKVNGETKEEKKEEEKPEEKKEEEVVKAAPASGNDDIVGRHTHVDGKTAIENWRSEYGPRMSDTYNSVCSEHLDNEWCHQHGYGRYSWMTGPWPIYLSTGVLLLLVIGVIVSLQYSR